MELKLQFNGSADGLINYLENFAKIRPTLLLEVDTKEQSFIAKGLVEDRSSVRYSALKFEDTNLVVLSAPEDLTERIQVGILNQLDKFIKILKRFNEDLKLPTQENEKPHVVDMIIRYANTFNDAKEEVLGALDIQLKSKKLSMRFACFQQISNFKCLTDEQFFNGIFNVSNETRFTLTQDVIRDIISTTDIVTVNAKEDVVIFNINNNVVSVSDKLNDNEATFKMNVAQLENTSSNDIQVAIRRETFLKMLGKPDSDYEAIIGYSTRRDGSTSISRVLFSAVSNSTRIAISSVTVG